VVPGWIFTISGSNDEAIMCTTFVCPFETGAVDWTAGWDEGAAGSGEDDDGAVHPQMIAIPTRRISRRTENFLIRDMIGGSPVILFLSRTGYRPVHGNRS
jgi:hypothetical protein